MSGENDEFSVGEYLTSTSFAVEVICERLFNVENPDTTVAEALGPSEQLLLQLFQIQKNSTSLIRLFERERQRIFSQSIAVANAACDSSERLCEELETVTRDLEGKFFAFYNILMNRSDSKTVLETHLPPLEQKVQDLALLKAQHSCLLWANKVEVSGNKLRDEIDANAISDEPSFSALLDGVVELIKLDAAVPEDFVALKAVSASRLTKICENAKDVMYCRIQAELEKVGWTGSPISDLEVLESCRVPLEAYSVDLLRLHAITEGAERTNMQWLLDALCLPLERRFRYHFGGNRGTNRVDKPEWVLSTVMDMICDRKLILQDLFQPIVVSWLDDKSTIVDILMLFAQRLVDMCVARLVASLPIVLKNQGLYCHLMDEIFKAERTLRKEFAIPLLAVQDSTTEVDPLHGFGFLNVLTNSCSSWERCVEVDLAFSSIKLRDLMAKEGAWAPMFDTSPHADIAAAKGLIGLLSTVSERLLLLPSRAMQLQYLGGVEWPLLKMFREKLCRRARGLRGRISSSDPASWVQYWNCANAGHQIVTSLKQWAADPSFIELVPLYLTLGAGVEKMHARPATEEEKEAAEAPVGLIGPVRLLSAAYSTVKQVIASASGDTDSEANSPIPEEELSASDWEAVENGGVWMEEVKALSNVVAAVIADGVTVCHRLIEGDLLPSIQMGRFWVNNACYPQYSSILGGPLETIKSVLNSGRDTLHPVLFRQLWKSLCDALEDFFWKEVIQQQRFPPVGVAQMTVDVRAIVSLLSMYVTGPPKWILRRLQDAVELLNAPLVRVQLVAISYDPEVHDGRAFSNRIERVEVLKWEECMDVLKKRQDWRDMKKRGEENDEPPQ